MAVNNGWEYRARVVATGCGQRLLAYLCRRYPHSSAAEWRERIERGLVLVDARRARCDDPVRPGQAILWRRPAWDEPEAPGTFAVLFEDDDLLAVAKPAGLPTLPGAGFLQTTLLHRVRAYDPDARPLHRLGRWTSGVVLLARTRGAREALSRRWAAREVRKRYRALARGVAERRTFDVELPIGPVPHALLGTVHAASPDGKPASSRVTVVEQREDEFLCDVAIVSGRPHQIRIHLAAAGHPLVGDPLYSEGGRPQEGSRALPGDPGYRLHAAALGFPHPRSGRQITVRCAPPPALRIAPHEAPFDA